MLFQVSILTSFATDGNPNENIINADMQNVQIDSVDTKEPPFMGINIEENLKFENLPEFERLAIWNQLYKTTNTRLY